MAALQQRRRPARAKGKGGRRLRILPVLIALLAAGGGATYFLVLRKPHKSAPPEESYTIALADLSVNLADTKRPHYLTTSVSIVVKGLKPQPVVEERDAQIRDAVIMVTTQHTYADLLSVEGKEKLKTDIAAAVDGVLAEEKLKVDEVLLTGFLME